MEPSAKSGRRTNWVLAIIGIGLVTRWIRRFRRGAPPLEEDKDVDALASRVAELFEAADQERLQAAMQKKDGAAVLDLLDVPPGEWKALVEEAQHLARTHASELQRQPAQDEAD